MSSSFNTAKDPRTRGVRRGGTLSGAHSRMLSTASGSQTSRRMNTPDFTTYQGTESKPLIKAIVTLRRPEQRAVSQKEVVTSALKFLKGCATDLKAKFRDKGLFARAVKRTSTFAPSVQDPVHPAPFDRSDQVSPTSTSTRSSSMVKKGADSENSRSLIKQLRYLEELRHKGQELLRPRAGTLSGRSQKGWKHPVSRGSCGFLTNLEKLVIEPVPK